MSLKYSFLDEAALKDFQFLEQLCTSHYRELYVKAIALDKDELPLEEIQGCVSQGSVSVDGNSIVRRTCSLTLAVQDLNINDYLWGLKTKIQLFIGLKNQLNKDYADIIWFNMGMYLLTSFNVSVNNDGSYSISLQGKDKMCLLNGDIGGTLTALSYDFANLLIYDEDGNYTQESVPLKTIIQEAVHVYGNEPYYNIIINDMDQTGLELLEYRGKNPIFYLMNAQTLAVEQCILDTTQVFWYNGVQKIAIQDILAQSTTDASVQFNSFAQLVTLANNEHYFTKQFADNTHYYLIKIEPGMVCGYRNTDLVYAGDLSANVGEAITTVLDKIITMLGNYEYFYNTDGQFVFQKKPTSIYTRLTGLTETDGEAWVNPFSQYSPYYFSFEDKTLITSLSNSPKIDNIKNDFSLWGETTSVGGNAIPIHMRYAIHKKPIYYISYDGKRLYTTRANAAAVAEDELLFGVPQTKFANTKENTIIESFYNVDWRELIYQMAFDYNKYQSKNNFLATVSCNNPFFYPTGYTGYEQYYTDMLEFWRTLYNPGVLVKFNPIDLSEYKFTQSAGNNDWYYRMPNNPTQCAIDAIYNDKNKYCKKVYTSPQGKDYYIPSHPTQSQFESDRTSYYIYTSTVKEAIPKKEVLPDPNAQNEYAAFYNNKGILMVPAGTATTTNINTVTPSPYNLYYKTITPKYILCGQKNPYQLKQYYIKTQDYKTITGNQIHSTGNSNQTYYTKQQNYIPVAATAVYQQEQQYYIAPNTYLPLKSITQAQFDQDPYSYYLKNASGKYVLINYFSDIQQQQVYWKYEYERLVYRLAPISESTYNLDPTIFFTLQEDYQPIAWADISNTNAVYYEIGDVFKPAMNVDQIMYNSAPLDHYYERVLENGQYHFRLPITKHTYSDNDQYYYKSGNTYVKDTYYDNEELTIEEKLQWYEQQITDVHMDNYYYMQNIVKLIPVRQPAIPYDENGEYYEQIQEKYIQDTEHQYYGWSKEVIEDPESLIFWIDFLDTEGELSQFSVDKIGARTKGIKDDNVTAIYYREVLPVLLTENIAIDQQTYGKKTGYSYIQLPSAYQNLFSVSSQGKSAQSAINDLLNDTTNYVESISLSTIPIYYLEPNSQIKVADEKSKIYGDYIVNQLSFPLSADGTMSISATKLIPPLSA